MSDEQDRPGVGGREFGALVRWHRGALHLSQEALAERCNLSVRTIRDLESGRVASPHRSTVVLLADGFALLGAQRAAFEQMAARWPPIGPSLREQPSPAELTPVPGSARAFWSAGPRLLPADLPDFIGRGPQLRQLVAGLSARDGVKLCAIDGPGGIGKTALAVHVAQQMAQHFPDGQLYVDLRAGDPQPREPREVLAQFINLLDGRGARAGHLDDLSALFRASIAGRRVLVVLDNAIDEAQVRPLLPGDGPAAVLVTSRRRLSGLDTAIAVSLAMFSPAESHLLLQKVLGAERVEAEPEAVSVIAASLGGLPLAIRVCGARWAARRPHPLAELAEALADEGRRLDELSDGDRSVRAGLAVAYQRLDSFTRRAFRLLGLLDHVEIEAWMLAALLGTGQLRAERVAEALLNARLLEPGRPVGVAMSRFTMHDLVRLYAAERLGAQETMAQRSAALRRLSQAWIELAGCACEHAGLFAFRATSAGRGPRLQTPGSRASDPPSGVQAVHRLPAPAGTARTARTARTVQDTVAASPLAWLAGMNGTGLMRALQRAGPDPGATSFLARRLTPLLTGLSLQASWKATDRAGREAATGQVVDIAAPPASQGDPATAPAVSRPVRRLGDIMDVEQITSLRLTRPLLDRIHDHQARATFRLALGMALRLAGDPASALDDLRRAGRELSSGRDGRNDHSDGMVQVMRQIGLAETDMGNFNDAVHTLLAATGPGNNPAVLIELGDAHTLAGDTGSAWHAYRAAEAAAARRGDKRAEAYAWQRLGRLSTRLADSSASVLLARAGDLFTVCGDLPGITLVRYHQAEQHLRGGRGGAARERAGAALAGWRDTLPLWQARALVTYGIVLDAAHDRAGARTAWQEARNLFSQLGAPEVVVARDLLAYGRSDAVSDVV